LQKQYYLNPSYSNTSQFSYYEKTAFTSFTHTQEETAKMFVASWSSRIPCRSI